MITKLISTQLLSKIQSLLNLMGAWSSSLFFLALSLSVDGFSLNKPPTPPSSNYCKQYNSLTSDERQKISDIRFKLEKIDTSLSKNKLQVMINEILKSKMVLTLPKNLHEAFQSLIAEFYLRVQLQKTIGIKHLAYLEFKAFIDIITYHRAMDNKGFVSEIPFFTAKKNLEEAIIKYYEKEQAPIIQFAQNQMTMLTKTLNDKSEPSTLVKEMSQKFLKLETEKSKTLGLLELIFTQLLERNKLNREEIIAQNAITDISVNVLTAFAGFAFAASTGVATGGMSALAQSTATKSMTTMALTASAACAIGLSTRYSFEQINRSYLDISKAFMRSIQNNTKLACELGYQNAQTKNVDYLKLTPIKFNDESKPLNIKDYILTCGISAATALSPSTIGLGMDAIIAGLFVNASYNLVKESYTVLKEVPTLLKLQGQAEAFNGSPAELKKLQEKVKESEAKVTLYLLSMGHSTINSFRFGLLLNIDRKNISEALDKAKKLIASSPKGASSSDLQTMKLITEKFKPES